MQIPEYAHSLKVEEILQILQTSSNGLNESEVLKRQKEFGKNILEEYKVSKLSLLAEQFKSPLVLILLIASLISFAVGSSGDALLIAFIVLINTILGFWQELKALTSIEALKKMTESKVIVIRDGNEISVVSSLLIPGDIIHLQEGDMVPADLRLIKVEGLSIDESVLTGESVPVSKEAGIILPNKTLPFELDNMALSGTVVVKGSAIAVAVYTAQKTYLSSIAQKAQEKSPDSPLSKALAIYTKKHLILIFSTIVIVGIIALYQGRDLIDIMMLLIAEIVSAIPEGLPIVVTLVLTIGAMALSRKNVLVRYLPTVETLGSATVIASDKTGTITQGELIVKDSFAIDETFTKIAAALANESKKGKGDPIDIALAEWLGGRYEEMREKFRRTSFYPFDTKYRLMASANIIHDEHKIVVKGAYESLKEFANNSKDFQKLDAVHDEFAKKGLRVLAMGVGDYKSDNIETWQIDIVGLVGFLDPPKEDVKLAVETAKKSGIRMMMITGDNALTATAIAKEVGIYADGNEVLSGPEISEMDDELLMSKLANTTVWARMLPENKYRIVKLLQQNGEIVAVTGDGANDIPAIKTADLGIAMGSGSEATKAIAKMILLNDDLSVIVEAIRQGRIISDNIRKSIYFLVSTSIDEIILISGAILMGYPLPLYPLQILWINLVADSALDKTFPFIKEEGDVMNRKPKKTDMQFFDKVQIARTLYASIIIGLLGLWIFHTTILTQGYDIAVSTVFTAMIVAIWVNGLQSLKEHEPFLKNIDTSFTINPYLWFGITIGIILQAGILIFAGEWFHAQMPDLEALVSIVVMAVSVFCLIELRKWAELWYCNKRKTIE
ncbi:cation-transporting P-type ATPase [bacterium]|nr:cation-transporting P-type ATPase [bacterium]MBU1995344.1 cation-transporting P-type ATPase [bacterium]